MTQTNLYHHLTSAFGLTLLFSGTVLAQETPPPAPVPQPPVANVTQPNATTPPTPLPKGIKEATDTTRFGVQQSDIKPVTAFGETLPGQPLPGDPQVIRTLDEAIQVALRRNPNLLSAQERGVRTERQIRQILGGRGPQITLTGSYTRLANQASGFGGATGGLSPAQIQNPFPVGLQNTPPGSIPITLSGSAASGSTQTGQTGATSATGAATTGSAATAGQTRAAATERAGSSRQGTGQSGTTRQGTDPTDPPVDPTDPPPNQQQGGFGAGGGQNLNQYAVRATVSQFVDITGIFKAASQVGDLEKALTRLEIARLRQEVAFNVRSAYYNLLRSQAFVQVNEAAVASSQELVRVTEAQERAGVASQFDVLRARTQLDNNRQALIAARNQVAISRNAFANTVGIDPSTPVEPVAPTSVPALPELNEQTLVNQAIEQRPEYYQTNANLLKAELNIRLARRGLEPFVNVVATGNYNPEPVFFAQEETGSIGVNLNVPLWDGGATREAVEAAKSDLRSAQITKDQYVRGIKAEVQQAIVAVRDANERAQTTQQTVVQAREALRLANVRFQAGVDTQLAVTDAQTALTQAETNAVNAQYDYLAALARLGRAVGNPE